MLVLPWLYDLFEPCDLVGPNLGSPAVAVEREVVAHLILGLAS